MWTFKVKIVALLFTSANIVLLPTLPHSDNISPVNLLTVPFSLITSFLSLSETSLNDACKPDLSLLLSENLVDLPEAYKTCANEITLNSHKTHMDTDKDTGEIITSYGYPLEIHKVTTADGYILTVHRIPSNRGKPPVYLQHGLGGCSDNWILQYRNRSLAFLLADNGYDVWLANSRGSTYSLEHTTLKWNDPVNCSYWNFSLQEVGIYDITAITETIISLTGKPQIFYVGHSMGTTTYFVALDQVPELNDKILAGILLAPTGFISRTPSPFRVLAEMSRNISDVLDSGFKGRIDFPKKNENLHVIYKTLADICNPSAKRCMACDKLIFSLYGIDAPQMNYTNIPNVLSKYPNIMPMKSAFHYAQLVTSCTFRQYDYGPMKNQQIYNGSVTPPDYTLKNIRSPTYAFYSEFDNLCRPKDVQRTLDLLPPGTLKANIRVNSTYFNHMDFVLAKDARNLVYTKILEIFDVVQNTFHKN